jgi:hypothetical protein
LSYKSVLSFHKHPSAVVDHPIPSVPDIAHLYKIPGVDNQYNQQWTSTASILMLKFVYPEDFLSILRSSVKIIKPIFPGLGQAAPQRLNAGQTPPIGGQAGPQGMEL